MCCLELRYKRFPRGWRILTLEIPWRGGWGLEVDRVAYLFPASPARMAKCPWILNPKLLPNFFLVSRWRLALKPPPPVCERGAKRFGGWWDKKGATRSNCSPFIIHFCHRESDISGVKSLYNYWSDCHEISHTFMSLSGRTAVTLVIPPAPLSAC